MPTKLTEARWTHIALPSCDLDAAIEFYTTMTPLVVVATHADDAGRNAWLSNDKQVDSPFVLVIAQFSEEQGKRFNYVPGEPIPTLAPFAHIGIEMPHKEDVDRAAELGAKMGRLRQGPQQRDAHVGYICSLFDPDGNVIEFSWDQKVYTNVRALWGDKA